MTSSAATPVISSPAQIDRKHTLFVQAEVMRSVAYDELVLPRLVRIVQAGAPIVVFHYDVPQEAPSSRQRDDLDWLSSLSFRSQQRADNIYTGEDVRKVLTESSYPETLPVFSLTALRRGDYRPAMPMVLGTRNALAGTGVYFTLQTARIMGDGFLKAVANNMDLPPFPVLDRALYGAPLDVLKAALVRTR